jgi:hypothetical protein
MSSRSRSPCRKLSAAACAAKAADCYRTTGKGVMAAHCRAKPKKRSARKVSASRAKSPAKLTRLESLKAVIRKNGGITDTDDFNTDDEYDDGSGIMFMDGESGPVRAYERAYRYFEDMLEDRAMSEAAFKIFRKLPKMYLIKAKEMTMSGREPRLLKAIGMRM